MVTAATIEAYTPYRVGVHFSEGQLAILLPPAEARLAEEDPGLPPAVAEQALAYLVADAIELAQPDGPGTGKKKVNLGSESSERHDQIGQTGWIVKYEGLLANAGLQPARPGRPTAGGVNLPDANAYREYRLDRNARPRSGFVPL